MSSSDIDRMPRATEIPVADKVAHLAAPAAFGPELKSVEVIETHMAWVFLAGSFVYKLKKPVRYPFLDFSTCALREQTCREEVRLNRRLAPDVYLGVVPLTLDGDGRFAIDGVGATVDWLVKMHRLPEDRMLDRLIGARTVRRSEILSLADVLSTFYECAEPVRLAGPEYVARFAREHATNRDILAGRGFALEPVLTDRVLDTIDEFLRTRSDELQQRASGGRIVDGHGDLRPEHVCLVDPPVVIDCLEFNRELRSVDPFDELAFLGLECELLGSAWVGELVVETCAKRLAGAPSPELLAFYTAYRACLRARLTLAHLLEPEPRDPDKWMPRTRLYLALASRACLRLGPR